MLMRVCVSLKNGASRSLRAALWRFAELAHLIRPQKCRYRHKYLENIIYILTGVYSIIVKVLDYFN